MKRVPSRKRKIKAIGQAMEKMRLDQIRHLLAKPMNQRTHFLRVRMPNGGSGL